MTTWHWVRHAPTHQKTFVGWRDVPADLSDNAHLSRVQAHLPASALLVTSDLSRCIKTADALHADGHRRLPPQPGLRELHFGLWDGMRFSQVAARDPVISWQYWEEPGDIAAPGGESWNMAAARVQTVVDHLNRRFPDSHIVAIAHFGVILTQVQRALGISAAQTLSHKIDNLSVTKIVWKDATPELVQVNHHP
ncbi:MAG: histidine phosphatase family protein [Pseudomonadota bacterium]